MIQVKEFIDTDSSYAEARANLFLAELKEEQVVNVCYGTIVKPAIGGAGIQRSCILVVYKVDNN
ncbi:hypothetical protein RAC89_04085 [Paenibacillus sp. GD4]|jgi:hypothetical protein|uniref:hypothetical protein n=1 Tax=Paenibacillus TaxID=44249 RepID=UPI002543A587|nr:MULTISPECIES: hypothetical protein [Paenibacillus]MDQ1909686.1 hypothetical protein [Paenibacillus sp. GD4]